MKHLQYNQLKDVSVSAPIKQSYCTRWSYDPHHIITIIRSGFWLCIVLEYLQLVRKYVGFTQTSPLWARSLLLDNRHHDHHQERSLTFYFVKIGNTISWKCLSLYQTSPLWARRLFFTFVITIIIRSGLWLCTRVRCQVQWEVLWLISASTPPLMSIIRSDCVEGRDDNLQDNRGILVKLEEATMPVQINLD